MARIRSVKPELRTSLTVAAWPREVRYAWVLLWGYLDDHGRGRDDIRLIVADLFPLDRDVTEKKMGRWLDLWANGDDPVICRYETAGQTFLHAIKWTSHQRPSHPSDSRIPPCPTHEPHAKTSGAAREALAKNSGAVPESLLASRVRAEQGAGSREQGGGAGSKGAREQVSDTHTPAAEILVKDHAGGLPQAVTRKLIATTAGLLADGISETTTSAALTAWAARPGSGPGLLPYLAADLQLEDRLPKKPTLSVNGDAPPWCGHCDETNRWEDAGDDTWRRCPRCHPLAATPDEATDAWPVPTSLAFTPADEPPF
jgi:hypothetical protein